MRFTKTIDVLDFDVRLGEELTEASQKKLSNAHIAPNIEVLFLP
jgi:hypothetical protein